MADLEYFQPPLTRFGSWFGWLFKIGTLVKYRDCWYPLVQFPSAQQFDAIRNFPLHDSDILIASFPKSGCTFALERLFLRTEVDLGSSACSAEQRPHKKGGPQKDNFFSFFAT